MRKIVLFLILSSMLFVACTGEKEVLFEEKSQFTKLISEVDSIFNDPYFETAFWGVKIKSLDNGKVWYERNANKLFIPASNDKIITTATALDLLGPDFRFVSTLSYKGEIKDSVLTGDLIAFGNGDPTFYYRFGGDPLDLFRQYATELKACGITKVTGDVIGDDTAFINEHVGYGWPQDGLIYYYSAEFGPLLLNEGYVDIKVEPAKTTEGFTNFVPNIDSKYFKIVDKTTLIEEGRNDIEIKRAPGSNIIEFHGKLVVGSKAFTVSPTIHNPTLFYVTVLKEVLQNEGITVEGIATDCESIKEFESYKKGVRMFTMYESYPLLDIAKVLMKKSNNLYAETLARTSAWYKTGFGEMRAARKLSQKLFDRFNIDFDIRYQDGSGLSRYDLVSPNHLVGVLEGMYNSKYKNEWIETLPIAGVDGTLRRRMQEGKAYNNVKAKTGTLSNVKGLSGYVTTADGENIVFSFIVNSHIRRASDANKITDAVLEKIASYTESAE